ncbi:unnamed protein product [Ilex paraguariensis]|uniref:Uncharacterized protein n=1 Tax=Ilex paraguariensis TaxID=185542 RepID=A0ABC8TYA4_9AQUA
MEQVGGTRTKFPSHGSMQNCTLIIFHQLVPFSIKQSPPFKELPLQISVKVKVCWVAVWMPEHKDLFRVFRNSVV